MNIRVTQMQSAAVRIPLIGLVVFSLLVSAFLPRISIGNNGRDALEKAFQSQSALLHVFCMTAVPLKIVNDFLPGSDKPSSKLPANDSRGRADHGSAAASDYSMTGFDRGPLPAKYAPQRGAASDNGIAATVAAVLLLMRGRSRKVRDGEKSVQTGGRFFFLLPRSSIGDHAGKVVSRLMSPTCLRTPGFFML